MKLNYYFYIIVGLILLQSCNITKQESKFLGFWEGPHPENIDKKFYIQIVSHKNTIDANCFWTEKNFYDSSFKIDSLTINSNSLSFYIPNWNCYYIGKLSDNTTIKGGFSCENELFDTVSLIKNNEIAQFLTEAKPGCHNQDYRYNYKTPDSINDINSPTLIQSAKDTLFINSIIEEIINNKYGRINSFLIIKHSKLICEEYFYGYSKNDLHRLESSTKSITSLLIGIAKDRGLITDINEPLSEIFPLFPHLKKAEYSKISISNILSMTSGFSPKYEPYQNYDRIEFSLKRELIEKVGEKFIYDGGNTEILGAIIQTKSGMYADVFADKYLFKPLGIKNFDWSVFKQDSFPCMGGSLQLYPRDMAKIGLLVLNKGVFNNKQIVSTEWINESTSVKTKTHIAGDNYSYQWWNITIESNKVKYETIWANGMGSQFIYIIPKLDIVIVTTGYNYENDSWAITNGISKYLYLLDN